MVTEVNLDFFGDNGSYWAYLTYLGYPGKYCSYLVIHFKVNRFFKIKYLPENSWFNKN